MKEESKATPENGLRDGGELEALLRSHDWSQTPLGAIETWSADLKTTAQILLTELEQVGLIEKPLPKGHFSEANFTLATLHQANQLNAFRVKLADALRPLVDASDIQETAARILGEALGANRVLYIEVASDGKEVVVHCNYINGVAQVSGRYRLEDYHRNLRADHQDGHTQVVTDIPNNPTYTDAEKAKYRELDIATHIDVPLIKNNQFVALLAVHQSTPRQWTETEIKQVEETAERTWAAVERARAEAALRESEGRLAADLVGMRRLYDLYATLATELDLKTALNEILAVACEFTHTDRGCVQLISDDGTRLEMFAWHGYSDDSPFINHFRYEGFKQGCDRVRVARQRFMIEETIGYPGLEGTAAGEAVYAEGIRAAQSTPITNRSGESIGVLSTQFSQPHRPSDDELRLIDLLAWTAADFIERYRAHAALQESEEKYRSLFTVIDEGFCHVEVVYDEGGQPVDHRILDANPAFERQTNLTQPQGRLASDLMPGLEQAWNEMYAQVIATGTSKRLERYSPAFDRWFEVEVSRMGEQSLHRAAVVFRDITQRKHSEALLQASHDTFFHLVENSPFGVYIIDADFRIAQVSAGAQKAFANVRPLIGRDFSEAMHILWPESFANEAIARFQHTLETGEPYRAPSFVERRRDVGDIESYDWMIERITLPDGRFGVVCNFYDMTERQRYEMELQASEARFRNMADNAPMMTWVTDPTGYCTYLSQSWYDFSGQTEETGLGFGWLNATHPADRAPSKAIFLAANEHQEAFQLEYRLRRRDGVYRTCIDAAKPWLGADGTFKGYIGSVIDVEDRIQAGVALRQSEERYRTLFESIDEGFCVVEVMLDSHQEPVDYCILETNPAFEQQTGIQQAVGKTARELNLEAYWIEMYGRVALTGQPIRFESGSAVLGRWFDVYACRTGDPAARKVAIVFKDISERKQTEAIIATDLADTRLLRDLSARLLSEDDIQVLYNEIVAAAIALTNADAGTIQLLENATQDLLLLTAQGFDQTFTDYFYRVDARSHTSCGIALTQGTRTFVNFNVPEDDDPDGSLRMHANMGFCCAQSTPLVSRSGRVIGMVSTHWRTHYQPTDRELRFLDLLARQAADLIEQRQTEAERQLILQREQAARAEAERANRIKDEFLAVLSHELRSPLNPILGWTRLLQSGRLDENRRAEALKTIERNAKLQAQLIEDLLDISRIMQGKLSLTVAPVNLPSVISAAIETVRLAAEAKQIQVTLDLDPATSSISGDAARLQQVVWNLLTNAIKFTPEGGSVKVKLESCEATILGSQTKDATHNSKPTTQNPQPTTQNSKLKTQNSKRYAQITVTDTGKGINPQFLPHVFEYFRQEDGSTTRQFGGLGLGLAIVRQIVEMHGGTVWAESQGEEQGATFIVQLPTMKNDPVPSQPTYDPTDIETPLAGIQILLVDDEPDTLEFQAFLLEQCGARVTAVASGLEALQVLQQSRPNLLISDIGMPEMDGYMLLQHIRSGSPQHGGALPAIALTAYAAEIDQQRALQVGFHSHITKPVEPKALVNAIAGLLERP